LRERVVRRLDILRTVYQQDQPLCASLTGGDNQPTTEQPTTEPATTTAEPTTTTEPTGAGTTESADQLAPGLRSDGVTDALALANAHQQAFENDTFVKHTSLKRSNASESSFIRTTLYFANESHWRRNITAEGVPLALAATNGTFEQYANGERVLFRFQTSDNVSYGVAFGLNGDPTPPSEALRGSVYARDFVYTLFANADVTVQDSEGAPHQITGTAEELTVDGEVVTDVEFAANITDSGLIRTLDITYEQDDTTVERSLSFEATTGDPVERPDWYETALNRTGAW
jgi:hypothetical protein